jgi:hypothetical protein
VYDVRTVSLQYTLFAGGRRQCIHRVSQSGHLTSTKSSHGVRITFNNSRARRSFVRRLLVRPLRNAMAVNELSRRRVCRFFYRESSISTLVHEIDFV